MINIPVEPPITEYLHRRASRNGIPLSGTFEVTPVCNMNCKMCYVRMSKEQQESISPLRSVDDWLALGEIAKSKGMLYLLLTGGEPFSRPDFKDILSGLHKMGFIISINSNATMINEKTIEWLKETPPIRINVTLYGASNDTYENLCGNPNGFTQVTNAIRLLKEAGITVKINCSLTPYNVHDLEQIYAYAQNEGLLVQAASYMFPPLRKDISKIGYNERFSPEDASYYASKIALLTNGEDLYLEHMKKEDFSIPSDLEDDCIELEGDGITCRAGKCSFWITWDGRMLPCGMFPTVDAPNVFENTFDMAWQKTIAYANSIRLPAKCKNCRIKKQCKACAAMVYTESGNFHTVPDYRCKMAHHYPLACRQVAEEILNNREESK